VKLPAVPVVKVVLVALVMAGARAWLTTCERAVEVLVVKFVSPA
jgi:hypothetical protein